MQLLLETVGRDVAAISMAAGTFLFAYTVGLRLCSPRRMLLRWTATIAVQLWTLTVLFHLLALAHLFAVWPALVSIGVLASLAYLLGGPAHALHGCLARDGAFIRRVATRLRESPHRWFVLAFFVFTAPGLLHALLLPPLAWDTLTYHGVKPAMWVQNNGVDVMVGTGPWAVYQNMMGGAEVLSAWAMLAVRADTLAPAIDVLEWLALGLALLVLGRRLGVREPFGSAAVGFVSAVPTVKLLVGSGYVEGAELLALITGVTLGVEVMRGAGARWLLLAAGALGVAAGTKLHAIPIAGAVLLVLLVTSARRMRWTAAAAALVVFAMAFVPWMARNASRSGLPFSPVPVSIGPLTLGRASPEIEWYMLQPRTRPSRPYRLDTELGVLKTVFGSPPVRNEALGVLTIVPLVLSIPGFVRLASRARAVAALIGAATAATLAVYYHPGLSMARIYWSISSSRYLLPLVPLLAVVSVVWCRRGGIASRAYLVFLRGAMLFNLLAYIFAGFSRASFEAVAVLAASGAGLIALAVWMDRTRMRPAVWPLAVLAACLSLQTIRASVRETVLRDDFALHPVPKYWTPAVAFVDAHIVPNKIAVTSGPYQYLDNWFVAPFFGRHLQNAVVYEPVSQDGTLRRFGDVRTNQEMSATASFDAWNQRLREHKVTHVMSFTPPSLELEWMENHPEAFVRECGEPRHWGLFRVKYDFYHGQN